MAVAVPALIAFIALRANAIGTFAIAHEFYYPLNPLREVSTTARLITATVVWAYGIHRTTLPLALVSDYGAHSFTIRSALTDPIFLLSFCLIAALVVLGLRRPRGQPLLMVATALFFGFSAVTSNTLLAIGTIFGERLYFTPSFAGAFIVAWAWERGNDRRLLGAVLVSGSLPPAYRFWNATRFGETTRP